MSKAKPALRIGVAAMMLITVLAAGMGAAATPAPAPAPADSSEAISPASGTFSGPVTAEQEVCVSYEDNNRKVTVCYEVK